MALSNEAIELIIKKINTNQVEEPFFKMVLQRLDDLGYKIKEEDGWSIVFCIQIVENHIKNVCNLSAVPEGLKIIAVNRVCGEFLFSKKQSRKFR